MTCAIISKSSVNVGTFNEYELPYSKIKEQLRDTIWNLYCEGYTEFFSNCEYGIPLWSAEIVIALKMYNDIKLHIVMPFEEQATNWNEDNRDRFFTVHEKADTVTIMSNHYTEDCYEKAERYMRERSDLIICCIQHKGDGSNKPIQEALKQGKKVIEFDDSFLCK